LRANASWFPAIDSAFNNWIYNRRIPDTTFRAMTEVHTADLLALDTEALKGRLSELRRYL
jgi:hypothetical protein